MSVKRMAGMALLCAAGLTGADLFRDDFDRFRAATERVEHT